MSEKFCSECDKLGTGVFCLDCGQRMIDEEQKEFRDRYNRATRGGEPEDDPDEPDNGQDGDYFNE